MPTAHDTTEVNKGGRARTGPPASHSAATAAVAAVVMLLALAMAFAFGTEARRALTPEAFGVAAGLASALGIAVVTGSARGITGFEPGRSLVAFGLGAAALTVAPYVVMLNRHTDAPPGSETLFLTTAAWGALLALGLALSQGGAASRLTRGAGALLGLAGVAGVVANWERPSSFSPFFRYITEESWMLAAGVTVALLWWWLDRERERGALRVAALSAAAGALAAAAALGIARASEIGFAGAIASQGLLFYALATGGAIATGVVLLRTAGAGGVAAVYFLPAVALTLLTYVEQATRVFGPQPILLGPAAAGSIATIAAAMLVAGATRPGPVTRRVPGLARCPLVVVALSGAAALAALVSLALPAMSARVVGLRTSGATLDLRFTLSGAETVGSWMLLALALGAVAAGLSAVGGLSCPESSSRGRPLVVIAALAAGLGAWPFVKGTPLRTLTSFVPSEVQVDFGSEFASIRFSSLPVPVAVAALCGTALALGVLLVCAMRAGRGPAVGASELEDELL